MRVLPILMALPLLAAVTQGCGSQAPSSASTSAAAAPSTSAGVAARTSAPAAPSSVPARPVAPRPRSNAVVVSAGSSASSTWRPVASVGAQPAAWLAQSSGVTLLRFDQRLVRLALHAGSVEPGGSGWRYGSRIAGAELHRVVSGFNGGFRLNYGSVGFMADGRVAVPLSFGLGSIVTYRDGWTQIGAWRAGVPTSGHGTVESVLQDLQLLVDHGQAAASVESCPTSCWGATLGGGVAVARSALGITGGGQLVWAAGEDISPARLAGALTGAGARRAVELDINPQWVAGYLFAHGPSGPQPVSVVPAQQGIPGRLLTPYGRDFFTIVAR